MKTAKAALHGFLWIIVILLQIVVGFVTGYIFFAEGYGDLVFVMDPKNWTLPVGVELRARNEVQDVKETQEFRCGVQDKSGA